METRARKRLRLQTPMYDIIGDPGLSVVACRIIDYLDYKSLITASKTCQRWNDVIKSLQSVWQKHFKHAYLAWKYWSPFYLLGSKIIVAWARENLEIYKDRTTEEMIAVTDLLKSETGCAEMEPESFHMWHVLIKEYVGVIGNPIEISMGNPHPLPTLLFVMVACGQTKLVKVLIENGASPDTHHQGRTVLQEAVSNGHFEMVKLLLGKEAKMEPQACLLHLAASLGDLKIAKILVENGALINSRNGTKINQTPLHTACYHGKVEMVRFLIEQGCDLDIRDGCNETPLSLIQKFKYDADANPYDLLQIIRLLLYHGAA